MKIIGRIVMTIINVVAINAFIRYIPTFLFVGIELFSIIIIVILLLLNITIHIIISLSHYIIVTTTITTSTILLLLRHHHLLILPIISIIIIASTRACLIKLLINKKYQHLISYMLSANQNMQGFQ